jgi:hypothetical protein
MTRRAFTIAFLAGVALILFYIFGFYFLSGGDRAFSRSGGGFSGSGLLSGFFAPMTSIDRRLEANRDLLHSHGEWTFSGVASGDAFTGSLKVDANYDYVFSVQMGETQYSGSGRLIDDYGIPGLSCQTDPGELVVLGIRDKSYLYDTPTKAGETQYNILVLFKFDWGVSEVECVLERAGDALDK